MNAEERERIVQEVATNIDMCVCTCAKCQQRLEPLRELAVRVERETLERAADEVDDPNNPGVWVVADRLRRMAAAVKP